MNDNSFDKYLSYWLTMNYLIRIDNSTHYKINQNFLQQISLITSPFEQYAQAYLLIYEQDNIVSETNLLTLTKIYQKNLLTKLDSKNIVSILAASSSVISNALRTLNLNHTSNTLSEIRHMLKMILQPMSSHLNSKL